MDAEADLAVGREVGPYMLLGLEREDRLCRFLCAHLPASAGRPSSCAEFDFLSLGDHGTVFRCREKNLGAEVVCKFFGLRDLPPSDCCNLLDYELRCLRQVREQGFDHPPFQVVQPLGAEPSLACLLVEESIRGKDLDHYIFEATCNGKERALYDKVRTMARFFARLHKATERRLVIHFSVPCQAFRRFLKGIRSVWEGTAGPLRELRHLCDKWEATRSMWTETSSVLHGDVTPTNFIFDGDGSVTAIDLERMQRGDPVQDLGFLAAELKHHFALRSRNAAGAEPFIEHLYHEYSEAFPDPNGKFREMTERNPFYMALAEIRIARNNWLPIEHRRWLIDESVRCLWR